MSNWPEAVWVVQRLGKYFDFSNEVEKYRSQLNNVIPDINNFNTVVEELSRKIETKEQSSDTVASSFVSTETSPDSGIPSEITINPSQGTIWFISK